MYGNRLARDYGESVPDAWRSAINSLKQYELTRGLRLLLERGGASPPTLPQFVQLCRMADQDEIPPAQMHIALPPEYQDPVWAHAQKCMFAYLWDRGGASEASLLQMITVKNKIVAQFQDVLREDSTLTGTEIRNALFKAWDKLYQPMPEAEQQRHREHFQRTGYAANWLRDSQERAA